MPSAFVVIFPGCRPTDIERSTRRRDFSRPLELHLAISELGFGQE